MSKKEYASVSYFVSSMVMGKIIDEISLKYQKFVSEKNHDTDVFLTKMAVSMPLNLSCNK